MDLPDILVKRIKAHTARENMTFRALVISALERELSKGKVAFQLRDASAGDSKGETVSNEEISQNLAGLRDFSCFSQLRTKNPLL